MYPLHLFSLFPPFPREDKVFVAMSFDKQFDQRWEKVIAPAIRVIRVNGVALQPQRVDTRMVSDSILTEILTGISNSRVVLADVTAIGQVDDRVVRNGNVMYEVGLAHAVRLPEEVILFRSDKERLLFDVANIRVNEYDPDHDPDAARQKVSQAIIEAIREVDLRKHLAVQHAADSLDFGCWLILMEAVVAQDTINHPIIRSMGDALSNAGLVNAISRLLALGILTTEYTKITPEDLKQLLDNELPQEKMIRYHVSPFGRAVRDVVLERIRISSPAVQQELKELLDSKGPS